MALELNAETITALAAAASTVLAGFGVMLSKIAKIHHELKGGKEEASVRELIQDSLAKRDEKITVHSQRIEAVEVEQVNHGRRIAKLETKVLV